MKLPSTSICITLLINHKWLPEWLNGKKCKCRRSFILKYKLLNIFGRFKLHCKGIVSVKQCSYTSLKGTTKTAFPCGSQLAGNPYTRTVWVSVAKVGCYFCQLNYHMEYWHLGCPLVTTEPWHSFILYCQYIEWFGLSHKWARWSRAAGRGGVGGEWCSSLCKASFIATSITWLPRVKFTRYRPCYQILWVLRAHHEWALWGSVIFLHLITPIPKIRNHILTPADCLLGCDHHGDGGSSSSIKVESR